MKNQNVKIVRFIFLFCVLFSFSVSSYANDKQASLFISKCSGCHSIDDESEGLDLIKSASLPYGELIKAIKRMEENVGPMEESEIKSHADFVKSKNAKERIKQELKKESQSTEAPSDTLTEGELDPQNIEAGKKLFFGQKSFKNNGLSCISCHSSSDHTLLGGGKLGPRLEGLFKKYSKNSLITAIENASWKIMKAVYKDHPITKQESVHLVAYLESLEENKTKESNWLFHTIGLVGCLFLFGLLAFFYRKRLTDVHKEIRRH
ncbi:MAG: c-type cytochrome [Candidatus Melainabacteria bacterium]|nr:c-type cytochrome [Candidatus Melainabacteria bacterium]